MYPLLGLQKSRQVGKASYSGGGSILFGIPREVHVVRKTLTWLEISGGTMKMNSPRF
jgi:hypothetical protein